MFKMDGEMLKMNIIPDMDDLLDQLEAQENNNEDHNKSTNGHHQKSPQLTTINGTTSHIKEDEYSEIESVTIAEEETLIDLFSDDIPSVTTIPNNTTLAYFDPIDAVTLQSVIGADNCVEVEDEVQAIDSNNVNENDRDSISSDEIERYLADVHLDHQHQDTSTIDLKQETTSSNDIQSTSNDVHERVQIDDEDDGIYEELILPTTIDNGTNIVDNVTDIQQITDDLNNESSIVNENVVVEQDCRNSTDDVSETIDNAVESCNVDESPIDVEQEQLVDVGEEVQPQQQSLIASTHDLSAQLPTQGRLTESEMKLGKTKPYWIPDPDSPACLICMSKFTIINRRHHCRSCGRVLCSSCCSRKASLPYIEGANKKAKVCIPCDITLARIAEQENAQNIVNSTLTEITVDDTDVNTIAGDSQRNNNKSTLKTTNESAQSSSSSVEPTSSKRSVTFRDGVKPGSGTEIGGIPLIKPPKKKHSTKRAISRRVLQLQVDEELVCLLPDDDELPILIDTTNGNRQRAIDISTIDQIINNGQPIEIVIKRNLSAIVQICNLNCCNFGRVWCISSRGFNNVGANETVIIYDQLNDDEVRIDYDVLRLLDETYNNFVKEAPIRRISNKTDRLRMLGEKKHEKSIIGGANCAAMLMFSATLQCLDNLPLPSAPFDIGLFVHETELVWAIACPQRLLYRLGLEYGYYPTPIGNKRNRPSVFGAVGPITVMKVFTDFRNWSYRMKTLAGSRVALQDERTTVYIPKCCHEEIRSLVEGNRNMIAWGLDLNSDADSHLVCNQHTSGGAYSTQVISIQGRDRKVTGASFVILDGALKSAELAIQVNIVEDGVAIRLHPDAMHTLTEHLLKMQDFELNGETVAFRILWMDETGWKHPGSLISAIDGRLLEGQCRYAIDAKRLVTASLAIPGQQQWAMRLAQIVDLAGDQLFESTIETRIVVICEQIGIQLASTISPFIQSLIDNKQMSISLRVKVASDIAEYAPGRWPSTLDTEHQLWMSTLDDQLVPILFNLSAYMVTGFHVELIFVLVSTSIGDVE